MRVGGTTPQDLRLAVPAAAAWSAAALLQSAAPRSSAAVAAGAVLVGALLAVAGRMSLAAAAVGLAAGAFAVGLHVDELHRGPVAALAGAHSVVDLSMHLVRDPAELVSASGRSFNLVDATVDDVRRAGEPTWQPDRAPVVVFSMTPGWTGLLPGQRLQASCRLGPPRPGDTVTAVAFCDSTPQLVGRPPLVQRAAGRIRDGLRSAVAGLPADERGLVPGLVLGDVSAMPVSLRDDFRITGLTHLNAVSGANVAIVLGAVLGAVRRTALPRRARLVAAAVALAAFVVVVRPSPSVLRAAAMGAVVLVGSWTGRRASAVPALSAAVLILVVVDPFLARTPGFALSVLATAAIVLVAPRWTDRLAQRWPRPLAAAVAVPAAAQLACTPVLVAVFGQATPWAIPANLLAAPAVAPATLVGIVCALVAVASRPVAALLAPLAAVPAWWLAVDARTLSALPGAGLGWPRGLGGLALLAGAGLVGYAARSWLGRRRSRAMLGGCPR